MFAAQKFTRVGHLHLRFLHKIAHFQIGNEPHYNVFLSKIVHFQIEKGAAKSRILVQDTFPGQADGARTFFFSAAHLVARFALCHSFRCTIKVVDVRKSKR